MKKHSILIMGHATSFTLEEEFWQTLKKIAEEKKISLSKLIQKIDCARTENLSSAIRLYVLEELINKVVNDK